MQYEFFFRNIHVQWGSEYFRVMAVDYETAIRKLSYASDIPQDDFKQIDVETIYGNSSRETRTTEAETVQEAKTNPSTETKQT